METPTYRPEQPPNEIDSETAHTGGQTVFQLLSQRFEAGASGVDTTQQGTRYFTGEKGHYDLDD